MNIPTNSRTTTKRGLTTSFIKYRSIINSLLRSPEIFCLFWLYLPSPATASSVQNGSIVIHADKAWEGDQGEVLHFEGNFSMETSQWRVTGEKAEMTGDADHPEKVIVYGSPARIMKLSTEQHLTTKGHGERLVYFADEEILELHENAQFTTDKATIASSVIIYDLKNKLLKSAGDDGVKMVVQPSFLQKNKSQ